MKPAPTKINTRDDATERRRRSIRLPNYDYSRTGEYSITVCTRNRECLLGEVVGGRMCLNKVGRLVQAALEELPRHYPHVALDAWTIMPNHVHGIVVLTARGVESHVGTGFKPAPSDFQCQCRWSPSWAA